MHSIADSELGALSWNPEFYWWEGTIKLESPQSFSLYLFSRDEPDRRISEAARYAFRRVAKMEATARTYAASRMTAVYNREWSDGKVATGVEFARRLLPASIEIHEQGYVEFHFKDGGLFAEHEIGVRIKADGSFQEAVIEG